MAGRSAAEPELRLRWRGAVPTVTLTRGGRSVRAGTVAGKGVEDLLDGPAGCCRVPEVRLIRLEDTGGAGPGGGAAARAANVHEQAVG